MAERKTKIASNKEDILNNEEKNNLSSLTVRELLDYEAAIVLLSKEIENNTRLYDNSIRPDSGLEIQKRMEINSVRLSIIKELYDRVKNIC